MTQHILILVTLKHGKEPIVTDLVTPTSDECVDFVDFHSGKEHSMSLLAIERISVITQLCEPRRIIKPNWRN
jgi:hypothetical protein